MHPSTTIEVALVYFSRDQSCRNGLSSTLHLGLLHNAMGLEVRTRRDPLGSIAWVGVSFVFALVKLNITLSSSLLPGDPVGSIWRG